MTDKLDFSLPAPKVRRSAANAVIIILLLAVLAVGVVNLVGGEFGRNGGGDQVVTTEGLSAKQIEELAGKLESRNMYASAAEVWQEYLAATSMSGEGKARLLFRIGDLYLKADQAEKAIPYFYRSEMVEKVSDLEPQINAKLKESFEKAGQFAALRYEIKERTGSQGEQEGAGTVVAEIGQDKITAAGLDGMLERQIDAQLSQYAAMADPEEMKQQKQAMLSQINNPQNKVQFLQGMLAQEALYREALARQIDTDPQVKELLRDTNRRLLAQQLLEKELADKVAVSESDLQTYYQANQANYLTEKEARISHILLAEEQQARDVIERLNKGEDFAALARELSLDTATKESGGEIAAAVTEGRAIPGIGKNEELASKIFGGETGKVLAEPVKTDKGWEVILVREVTGPQQKTFEEVKQEIRSTLTSQKRQEAQQRLIEPLMDKYNIILHRDAILKETSEENKNENSKKQN